VLLNETFSSTSASEAVYLAQDMLSALCALGVRAIFATHLTELVERIADIEAALDDQHPPSSIFSLVAGVRYASDGTAAASYEIKRGAPLGRSYAQEIARRYGISLAQLLAVRQAMDSLNGL
ncbi:MAG: hypothetical protein H7Y11_11715, partial [Armatimonadetes bacterium]|nr:hypothetical protein [Anaerolineae bacterium]